MRFVGGFVRLDLVKGGALSEEGLPFEGQISGSKESILDGTEKTNIETVGVDIK